MDTSYYGRLKLEKNTKLKKPKSGVHKTMLEFFVERNLQALEERVIKTFQESMQISKVDLFREIKKINASLDILFLVEANKLKLEEVLNDIATKEKDEKEAKIERKKKNSIKKLAKQHSSKPRPEDFEDRIER